MPYKAAAAAAAVKGKKKQKVKDVDLYSPSYVHDTPNAHLRH